MMISIKEKIILITGASSGIQISLLLGALVTLMYAGYMRTDKYKNGKLNEIISSHKNDKSKFNFA